MININSQKLTANMLTANICAVTATTLPREGISEDSDSWAPASDGLCFEYAF